MCKGCTESLAHASAVPSLVVGKAGSKGYKVAGFQESRAFHGCTGVARFNIKRLQVPRLSCRVSFKVNVCISRLQGSQMFPALQVSNVPRLEASRVAQHSQVLGASVSIQPGFQVPMSRLPRVPAGLGNRKSHCAAPSPRH